MKSWKRLPLILLLSVGLLFLAIGCAKDEEEPAPPPEAHLSLGTHTLDFGSTLTQQEITVSNTGNATLTWNIDSTSIPNWAEVTPASGTLSAGAETLMTVRISRSDIEPGTTTATLLFITNANDDSVTLSVQCNFVLGTHALDFGTTTTERQIMVSNTGEATLTWEISATSIPGWAEVTPASGSLLSNSQTTVTVRVSRESMSPGTTTGILLFITSSNDDSVTLSVQCSFVLGTHTLDFGTTVTEQQFNISNTGDAPLTWTIAAASIPYWAKVTPTGGTLAADAQTTITVRVYRIAVDPGITMARPFFDTNVNDDSLTLFIQRNCDLLGDDFNSGNATGWTATAVDKSQGDGYVVLNPNSAYEPGRLMETVTPVLPCVISARLERITQTASYKQYGLLLEGTSTANALYFTVFVDNDTNYTLEQRVGGWWETLQAGYTSLLSTAGGEWNILRLELYHSGQNTYARGYADTTATPLFDGIAIDQSLSFVKMGIRSEEYTIHADWFCATH